MKKLLFLFICLSTLSGVGQNEALFEQGKELYKAENYQAAIDSWMNIIETKNHSDALYFNLANAHYKLNNIGPSIYYYEKALQLNPNDSDIRNNLRYAENARIDVIEPLPETVFKRWYKGISGILTYDGWAILTTVLSSLFVILFLLYYFSYSERTKRLLFSAATFTVFLFLFSLVLSFKTFGDFKNNHPAILFAETSEIRSEPSLGSEPVFVLHEGTKVTILEKDDQWVRIILADGKDGWIPASDLKEL